MMASRGMGIINPSKMPSGKRKARRDDTDFTEYAEGGAVKSKVNEAGNYTKPGMRKSLFEKIKGQALKDWTDQKWRTKSGKPSSKTGERYLPEAAIKALSPQEYAASTRAKRAGKASGKQFVAQPKAIAKKTARFR